MNVSFPPFNKSHKYLRKKNYQHWDFSASRMTNQHVSSRATDRLECAPRKKDIFPLWKNVSFVPRPGCSWDDLTDRDPPVPGREPKREWTFPCKFPLYHFSIAHHGHRVAAPPETPTAFSPPRVCFSKNSPPVFRYICARTHIHTFDDRSCNLRNLHRNRRLREPANLYWVLPSNTQSDIFLLRRSTRLAPDRALFGIKRGKRPPSEGVKVLSHEQR